MQNKKNMIVMKADPCDPEDRDVSAEGLERGHKARLVRLTRTRLGLSQSEFAGRFCVPVKTLQSWEQARVMPPAYAIAYVRVIGAEPDRVAELVA
mgnify:CR=1 FL=1